ncbi:MAG: 3'-5' exonuclease [Puniceicoccales bacterium]|jgi:DNA polymerase-3 subunit epsilon|nr:3'-5' exonuclease [Puniceicoccales bacterium]
MSKIAYIDLETTGLSAYKHGIVQIALIIETDGVVRTRKQWDCSPHQGKEVDPRALEVIGLPPDEVWTRQNPLETHKELVATLGAYVDKYNKTDKFMFCGYNSQNFDMPFLRQWFLSCGDKFFGSWFYPFSIDVGCLVMAHSDHELSSFPDFKLKTVCTKLGLSSGEDAYHAANFDIEKTRDLYKCLIS